MIPRIRIIDKVVDALTNIDSKVELSGCLNLQDINVHLENVFRDLLNLIYTDREFKNLNSLEGNYTAIDLGDNLNDIAIQVTSDTSRKKVVKTLDLYKKENNFSKVIMLYCKIKKPSRQKDFSDIIQGRFDFEEWSLKCLQKKIMDLKFEDLENVANLLQKEILTNSNDLLKYEDNTAISSWAETSLNDARNIKDKLNSVCSDVKDYRVSKYCTDIASGRLELQDYSDRDISSLKYRIFEVCQEELVSYCERGLKEDLSLNEVKEIIDNYTNKAVEIISDKSKSFNYPKTNKDLLRKVVLALIDECYLSFDVKGIYNG
ncbi:MAG: SMEK domain-containing protein [Hyphomicrobiales bacterium]